MFGTNKNKKDEEANSFFQFPLEQDLDDPKKVEELMGATEERITSIKKLIKEGAKPENFEKLGTLLHAYSALLKIFNQVPKKK